MKIIRSYFCLLGLFAGATNLDYAKSAFQAMPIGPMTGNHVVAHTYIGANLGYLEFVTPKDKERTSIVKAATDTLMNLSKKYGVDTEKKQTLENVENVSKYRTHLAALLGRVNELKASLLAEMNGQQGTTDHLEGAIVCLDGIRELFVQEAVNVESAYMMLDLKSPGLVAEQRKIK